VVGYVVGGGWMWKFYEALVNADDDEFDDLVFQIQW
jgi:hypothetical protein